MVAESGFNRRGDGLQDSNWTERRRRSHRIYRCLACPRKGVSNVWLIETLIRRCDTASSLQARRLVSLKIRQHQSGIFPPCQCTGRCSVRQHIVHGEQHDSYPMVFLMFIYMHTPCLISSPLHVGLEPALNYCRGIQHPRLLPDSSLLAPMSRTETYTMED